MKKILLASLGLVVILVLVFVQWLPISQLPRNISTAVAAESKPKPAGELAEIIRDMDEGTIVVLETMREFWKREEIVPGKIIDFPPFSIPPRTDQLELYPCMECHEDETINISKERKLEDEHEDLVLDHGGNRFWCPTCHNLGNMDYFRSMKNKRIDFDRPYLLCGQCHFNRQEDWFFGGHGKRIGNWQGKKIILTCTECHDPHSPTIKPKMPDPPPERYGGPLSLWEVLRAQVGAKTEQ